MLRLGLIGIAFVIAIGFSSASVVAGETMLTINPADVLIAPAKLVNRLPILEADDANRVFNYFDAQTISWVKFAYPDGLDSEENYTISRSDGTFLISSDGFCVMCAADPLKSWVFEPSVGKFKHPEMACGRFKDLPNEGYWTVIDDKSAGISRLCSTETGEVTAPIPSSNGSCSFDVDKPAVVSPNKQWILVFCGDTDFAAYSYEIATKTFRYLGSSKNGVSVYVEVVKWLDEDNAIIYAYPPWNPPSNTYYVVNVSKLGDLEEAASDLYIAPFYYDDPPHLEWMPCEFGNCGRKGNENHYGLERYDFKTRTHIQYPYLDRIWGVGSVIPDGSGDRLYRSLNYDNRLDMWTAPSATLIRYNYETKQVIDLYTGEIEWFNSFSPDGRYVVLFIGHNKTVAANALLYENQANYKPDGQSTIQVFDLQTQKVVYTAVGESWDTSEFAPIGVQWITANQLLIFQDGKYDDLVVTFGNQITEKPIDLTAFNDSPDRQRLIVKDQNGNLAVYEVASGNTIPIISRESLEKYSMVIHWNSNTDFDLRISNKDHEDIQFASWRVEVP
ncbi:MAG: hypothetical protein H0X30_37150 [Anaerolineae bacterium]|nr:hypothetical protein [Anaerolineae bacterium]